MNRPLAVAGACFLMLLAAAAATKTSLVPNLSGTWLLDRSSSKLGKSDRQITAVIIEQSPPVVTFDYWSGERRLGVETVSTNGEARQKYSTRVEKAVIYGRFDRNTLRVSTDHIINWYWGQQFTEVEEWTISADGSTLTHRLSTGKTEVFRRKKADEPSAERPLR